MLILSRKSGESLMINEEIEIKIIEVNGDKVKIGIDAPKNVKILRKELSQTM
ncbi:MAG: carbon storage regulator CsrA [Oscillospiraceae bacterium]